MEEEIELRDYIDVLLKWKWLIVWITIVSIAVAGTYSYFIAKPVYKATGSLLVNPGKAKINITTPEQLLNPLTFLPQISVNTYQDIIKNPDLEKNVIENLHLNSSPYNITIGQLNNMITVTNPKNTTIIKVSVDYTDSQIAQKIATEILKEAVDFIKDTNKSSMGKTMNNIQKQVEIAKKELEDAQKTLADFNSQSDNIANLNQERVSYTNALSSYLSQILSLDYQINQYKKELSEVQYQLKKTNKYFTIEQSIMDTPLLAQLAQDLSNTNIIELSKLKVNSQQINPVYEDLLSKQSNYAITLSGLKTKKESLNNLINDAKTKIHSLDEEINKKQLQLYKLQRDLNAANTYYNTILSNYQQAVLANENILIPATILANPVVPTHPVKPKKMFNMAVAGTAGLFFAILLAFFLEYWYSTDEEGKRKKELKA